MNFKNPRNTLREGGFSIIKQFKYRGHKLFIGFCSILLLCGFFLQVNAAEKHVTLAATEYPPYYGEQLDNQGFITEIIRKAFQRVGYGVTIKFLPWKRALEMTKEGDFDGMYTGWYREDREQWFVFSDPLPPNEVGFYSLKKHNISFTTLEDLRPYKIGVVRGYRNPPEFEQAALNVEEVTEDLLNMRKLQGGRIALVLIDRIMGQYLIHTAFPDKTDLFQWLAPPLKVDNQYLMFSKRVEGYQQILADFNQGLRQLAQEGEVEVIISKHGFSITLPAPDAPGNWGQY